MQAYSPLGSSDSPLLTDPDIIEIAERHGASVSQILISWQGQSSPSPLSSPKPTLTLKPLPRGYAIASLFASRRVWS